MPTTTRATPRRTTRGFTLLELMIVLVIIAVLGAVVGFNMIGGADKARAESTRLQMDIVKKALTQYRVTYSAFPPTEYGLQVLVTEKILEAYPKDGWGRELDYYSPTASSPAGYELISYGPDGLPGTPDDIRIMPDL